MEGKARCAWDWGGKGCLWHVWPGKSKVVGVYLEFRMIMVGKLPRPYRNYRALLWP